MVVDREEPVSSSSNGGLWGISSFSVLPPTPQGHFTFSPAPAAFTFSPAPAATPSGFGSTQGESGFGIAAPPSCPFGFSFGQN
jgi:hypothetical protein